MQRRVRRLVFSTLAEVVWWCRGVFFGGGTSFTLPEPSRRPLKARVLRQTCLEFQTMEDLTA